MHKTIRKQAGRSRGRRKRRATCPADAGERPRGSIKGDEVDRAVGLDRVVCADNAAFMRSLPDGCCGMIYADPPFFTKKQRRQLRGNHTYSDRWPGGLAEYADFLIPRLAEMRRLLGERGTLFVQLDWHVVHYVKVALDELFGYENFINEIIWSYRTGGVSQRCYGRKHDTILSYAKTRGRQKFHVVREGEFRTDGLKYDKVGRPYKSTRNGRLYFHADGPALTDVWELPFLSTVSLERTGYPTQKPLSLLRRLVRCATDADDVVGDFFCGSGTALVAAAESGRRYVGCDAEREAVQIARDRLMKLSATSKGWRETVPKGG